MRFCPQCSAERETPTPFLRLEMGTQLGDKMGTQLHKLLSLYDLPLGCLLLRGLGTQVQARINSSVPSLSPGSVPTQNQGGRMVWERFGKSKPKARAIEINDTDFLMPEVLMLSDEF